MKKEYWRNQLFEISHVRRNDITVQADGGDKIEQLTQSG